MKSETNRNTYFNNLYTLRLINEMLVANISNRYNTIMDQFFAPPQNKPPAHYYEDTMRKLFFAEEITMLSSLPFFTNNIPFPIRIPILIMFFSSFYFSTKTFRGKCIKGE